VNEPDRPSHQPKAYHCTREGCDELVVPADQFTGGQVVSWRADGSPDPTARLSVPRRRLKMAELIARLRR
jgi:hypothetical protein